MSIRDDARQEAERRYPALNPDAEDLTYPRSAIRRMTRGAFEAGAVWASEQADREPSDAEVSRAAHAMAAWKKARTGAPAMIDLDMARAALLAAQEVRRADNS